MNKVSFREINQSKLSSTPIIEGCITVCSDSGRIYKDTSTEHKLLSEQILFVDELPIAPLLNKFYFYDNALYLYVNDDWVNLNGASEEQIRNSVNEYFLENPPDTGVSIDDNSVSQDSTWSSRKIASELNKIEHTLTISLNAIDGGDIYTTVIIEDTATGEVAETLDYNNEILYVVLPKYFGYRVTIGDVDGYAKPNVNVFTGIMNRDITISATYKFAMIYGYHVNNNESDPSSAVTYIEDAVGFTPAKMNYSTDVFGYGSWENAFFMPRPCMLKRDGTVDC